MPNKVLYAFSACLFAAIAMIGAVVYGSEEARHIMLWAALVAAWSQFVAQDARAQLASVALAYVSMALAAWALVQL